MAQAKERASVRLLIIEAAALGVLAGAGAHFLRVGVNWLGSMRVHISTVMPPELVLPLFGVVGGVLSGLMVRYVAPDTTGSGIPQVKASLTGEPVGLGWKALVTKLTAGVLSLGCGLPLGREGPTVQIGACIAHFFNQLGIGGEKMNKQLLAAGAGAGLAAAFNAPLAGIIFVMEELVRNVSTPFVMSAALACFGAALLSRLLLHNTLDMGVATEFPPVDFRIGDVPSLIILGIICGAMGALFNVFIIRGSRLNARIFGNNFPLRIGLAGLICGVSLSFLPAAYHDLAEIKHLVATEHAGVQFASSALAVNYLLTVIAYCSGAPGGLFGPSLTIGSCAGYLLGEVQFLIFNQSTNAPALLSLVGMGAFFSGVARVPITATVIVFEITRDFNLFLPLLIANVVAYLAGEALYPGSVYDRLLEAFFSKDRQKQ